MLNRIKELFRLEKVRFSLHAIRRIDERQILISEIEEVIFSGEIIESYPDDDPCSSYLILGYVRNNEPLYILCAVGEYLTIVTVHWFDPEKWINHRTRRNE